MYIEKEAGKDGGREQGAGEQGERNKQASVFRAI